MIFPNSNEGQNLPPGYEDSALSPPHGRGYTKPSYNAATMLQDCQVDGLHQERLQELLKKGNDDTD